MQNWISQKPIQLFVNRQLEGLEEENNVDEDIRQKKNNVNEDIREKEKNTVNEKMRDDENNKGHLNEKSVDILNPRKR